MARRRSRRTTVRGKPNYLWVNTAGELATINTNTVWSPLLQPGDWSGTVTETQCTLLRLVVSCYTSTLSLASEPHAENCAIVKGSANDASPSAQDISNINEWPDFFAAYDEVLRIFRLEWDGALRAANLLLPVQFSQLPEPVLNLKTPRHLKGDDSIRLCVGGGLQPVGIEAPVVTWFCRALVRTGLR